jgi:hypothetical protein
MQADLFGTPGREDRQVFDAQMIYRYELERYFGDGPPALFCGLNPSKAGLKISKDDNDPTVRKWIGFARRWGCGSVLVVNAYGYIETKPAVMWRAAKTGVDIVGPENDRYIRAAVDRVKLAGGKVCVCWGQNIQPTRQAEIAYVFGDDAMCLGHNKDGSPEHALYIPYERPLQHWQCP